MASRSVKVSIERRRAGDSMNDNYPSVLPGHELAGLDGVPRPPAAEAVAHYSRFTQIGSFPDHPAEPVPDASEPPIMDALTERPDRALATIRRSVTFACLGSFLFHAAIVTALLVTMVAAPEDAVEEAGDTVSVIMLGSSDLDQMSAGEESAEPQPEQVTADAVQPETVQPTDVKPTEAEAVQPPTDGCSAGGGSRSCSTDARNCGGRAAVAASAAGVAGNSRQPGAGGARDAGARRNDSSSADHGVGAADKC